LNRLIPLTCLVVLSSVRNARGDVSMPNLFGDGMVLQQGMEVPIWGWAENGERVTVEFRNQKVATTAKDGKWQLKLRKLQAGGPDSMTITGKNQIQFQNVLVGEVWICSGQSNMEWPLSRSFDANQAIPNSGNPVIRLFTVRKLRANEPTNNVTGSWTACGPDTVTNFSAVAYYFGRDLQRSLGVPIGLIHTSWGGSPAEVWMKQDVLAVNPDYKETILDAYTKAFREYQDALAQFEREAADLAKEGKSPTRKKPSPPYWKPTELYNGMIAPLVPYAMRGAIWYQGESNAGRAQQYRTLFPDMIRNWRRDWGQGDFAFIEVQLAPWDKGKKRSLEQITASPGDSDWAELREAQTLATKALPKVEMAVITDVGDKDDIHPTKKEPVGSRLGLAARRIAYNESIVYSGPRYKGMKVDGDKVWISFQSVGAGLEARGGELKGFAVAGPDQRFVWAKAQIQGDQVVVSSPEVSNPVAVRYGWADYPVVNLWNKNGLPASPFRTDDFPMVTQPKKQLSTKM
jgi:sialate O-acetylesterase